MIGRRSQRGAVTAETALMLPLLLAVTAALVWLQAVGAAQVRVVDAAREGARAAARGDPVAEAQAAAMKVAPEAGAVTIGDDAGTVVVEVTGAVEAPFGAIGRLLPAVRLHALAYARAEDP